MRKATSGIFPSSWKRENTKPSSSIILNICMSEHKATFRAWFYRETVVHIKLNRTNHPHRLLSPLQEEGLGSPNHTCFLCKAVKVQGAVKNQSRTTGVQAPLPAQVHFDHISLPAPMYSRGRFRAIIQSQSGGQRLDHSIRYR